MQLSFQDLWRTPPTFRDPALIFNRDHIISRPQPWLFWPNDATSGFTSRAEKRKDPHHMSDPEKTAENKPSAAHLPLAEIFDDVIEFANQTPAQGRLLGIDPGTKTFGLALSDVTQTVATALEVIKRKKFSSDSERILEITREHQMVGFVVGLPTNLDGSEGPRAQSTRAFARNLAKLTPLPILLWDERLSTVAAERALLAADTSRRKRAEVIDKVAATVILQGALDRMRGL